MLHISLSVFAHSTRSALLASGAMAAMIFVLGQVLSGLAPQARFFISVAVGAVTYLSVALALERSLIGEVTDGLRSRIGATT